MLLVILRYIFQGEIDSEVALEVAYIGALRYGREIEKDTLLIREGLQGIGRGEFNIRLDSSRADDLGGNSRGDHKVRMGGERTEVVVLMADIRDFTPLSESMEPEELTILPLDLDVCIASTMLPMIHAEYPV